VRVTYESAGIRRFVLAGAVTRPEDVGAIREALGGMPLKVVLLDAPSSSVIERLAKRDIASKTIGTDDDLHEFDERVRSAAVADCTVQNVEDPRATASEILAWAKWL
jgi:dephospho-CoA kinase